ncbi:MAG: UDP-N-acetylmuramoyl-L-alanine--D-glutamate ligase [Deltaproteobacteria bacterium]|nr:UDP-N-acetylmuramoyl-L-alanine--D-glutamate ligase [Deltaproteobacteria bacterium]
MKWAIAGKGRSGQAAYRFVVSRGDDAVLLDDAEQSLTPEAILNCDAVILSPGIPRKHVAIQAALKAQKPLYNEIDLVAPKLSQAKFVGITGTNGKSTTAALLVSMVKEWEPSVFVGGNFGKPLCEAALDGDEPKVVILELSSYQLETLSQLKLDVAVLLNLSPDHLERYDSVEDYYETKRRIFDLLKPEGVKIEFPPLKKGGQGGFKMPPSLLGPHNLQNMNAAIQAAQALGVPDDIIQKGLDNFKGMPHRLEILGKKNGVTFVNDSKATTVESTIAALNCFDSGVHLICGGKGKGSSYVPLVKTAQGKVKQVYAIGEDAPKIIQTFPRGEGVSQVSKDLKGRLMILREAFVAAVKNAQPGDVILLSPACSSYDQFKNFEERGELFRSLFNAL